MMLFRITFLIAICSIFLRAAETHDEYQAKSYAEYIKYNNILKNTWLKGAWVGDEFIFEWEDALGKKVYFATSPQGKKRIAFNQELLARKIADLTKKKISSENLPIENLRQGDGGIDFKIAGKLYTWKDGELKPVKARNVREYDLSPDGKWRTHVDGGKLFLEEIGSGKEKKLLMDGDPEKQTFWEVAWAPDSKKFVIGKVTKGQGRKVKIVESSPKNQLQPKLHVFNYDKPGDVISVARPWVFFVDGSEPFAADDSLLVNPFRVRNYKWRDENTFTYSFVERGYGKHHLILADVIKREHRVIIREDSDTYIYVRDAYAYKIDKGKEIIWRSERGGWSHLYLYDGVTGEVKNQITKGEMTVHEVVHVDEEKRRILFVAGGEIKGIDPYYRQYYWVNFDGSGLKRITRGGGNHYLEFSDDYSYAVDSVLGADRAGSYQIIDGNTGKVLSQIGGCDVSELTAKGWQMPEVFSTTDRDGKFEIWGTIHRPANFDPKKKYPVIENIYAGPHDQHVPKVFRFWNSGIHELTMRGFIVVRIDGKGTNKRCKEFSHFCYKNIVDAGFPDRIKWIKEAAKKYPQMDIERVGIFGGSAGGQNSTGALLHHGEFYKAAFSDCGCHDNRMDKIWWNEQWMDYPIGKHYQEQSNVTNAHKLKGALMLTVGELDRNVDPASTLQVVNALMKADKDFEYYIAPSGGHGAGEKLYLRRKRAEFFKKHLGEVK